MSTLRYVFFGAIAMFGVIGAIGWMKKSAAPQPKAADPIAAAPVVQEVIIPEVKAPVVKREVPVVVKKEPEAVAAPAAALASLPDVDRIQSLFATDSTRLPIVETVSYTSRVPWLKGRPAWIADYASHYETSRHFIARSLNRKADYFTQKVGPGDKFNVFKKDKNIQFHLLIDLSRNKMWFYSVDMDAGERYLLKTYPVGVGRVDPQKKSGCLTPVGRYSLGEKVAIYKPGTMGFFQDQKTEMIQVFGTRWIPFEKEIEGCSEGAKGYGIHGVPWTYDAAAHKWVEDRSQLGKYSSDGCIRLAQEDMEEIFSIVITKPTTVELVKDFHDAKLPGVEK